MDKKIARDTIVTFASTGVYFAALTVTSILIVKLVGVEGRGLYAEATLLPTAICVIGWLGLPSAVAYRVASAGSTRDVTIGTARTIALVLSLILCVVSIIICAIAPLDPAVRIESILFALFIPLNLFIFLHRAIVQADLRSGDFNVLRLAAPLVYVLALVALWMVGHATVMTLVVTLLIANGFALVVSCVLARGGRWFAFSRTEA